jgi:3-oxoacyl-[acyl-carrier-protein] synthase II
MKITLIYPRFEKFLSGLPELDAGLVDYFLGNFTTPPSLGIPILAALTPPDIQIEFIDDNGGMPVDFDAPTDLVAINCFTPQATRAFEIADGFRARGRQVIMGGFFPSFMAEECLKHADAVNIGEGEPTWPLILEDARRGLLKPKYHGGHSFDLARMPIPRREIFYGVETYDWDEDLVQVTRGCSYGCHMCAIPAHMGNRIRFRPIDKVVEEVRGLKHENVYLADDSLFFPQRRTREYAEALFKALEPLGKKYFVSSTMALNVDPAFLDLAVRAGMRNFYCTMNVDPVSIKALQGEARERQVLVDLVRAIEDRGARFFASCAIGRDWDGPDIGERVLDLFDAAGIRTAEFFLFTPYPGTPLWERLERQGRIIDRTWSHYNGAHVVTRPLDMTPEALREQFLLVWREFFKRQKERHATHLEPATWKEGRQVVGKPLQRQGVENQAAITGIGILSPIGNDPETVTAALRAGSHGIEPITRFDASSFRTNLVGEVRLDPALGLDAPDLAAQFDDPYLRFATVAARRALRDAGVAIDPRAPRADVALVLGTCNGGLRSGEAEYSWKHGKSDTAFDERMNLQAQFYGFGKAIANALGISAEAWVVTTACSSSTAALGLAQQLINRGHFSTVLVGGADVLCVANMAGFDALKATSTTRMAPFSLPCGINIGEAACFWVVENMEQALLRKARILGRLAGHATTADAYHPTSPDPRGNGVYRTLRDALADSGLPLEQIGCINAHGSGTEANDRAESKGIQKFLGDRQVPVVSTKSFFGHCMGATGILETTCQLLAMNAGFIPPTINFTEARPGCTLDYVPNEARPADYAAFISANYAFGGNNAAVVVTRWDHPSPPRPRRAGRVVITGLGAVTAAGIGTGRLLEELRAGRSCVAPVTRFPLPERLRSRLAGLVAPFREAAVDRRLDFSSLNDISRYAVSAAKLALDDARLRVGQANAERVGVTMGVCNGTAETAHMDSVFGSDTYAGNVSCFSNIVPNSTAGWVSSSLQLKGVNCTLAAGPHAGLQSLAYAYEALTEERALAVVAAASDEIYPQTYYNYDTMSLLCQGAEEEHYQIRPDEDKRKVLGEGAGALMLETAPAALERGATILAEVLGQGMTMDAGGFLAPNLDPDGLRRAIELSLERAGATADEVDLLIWAPQGNRQDLKVLEACRSVFGERFASLPLAGSTFTTGFIESASILTGIAATLQALKEGKELWPQRTGLAELDGRALSAPPRLMLAVASSDVGYNFSIVLRNGWTG